MNYRERIIKIYQEKRDTLLKETPKNDQHKLVLAFTIEIIDNLIEVAEEEPFLEEEVLLNIQHELGKEVNGSYESQQAQQESENVRVELPEDFPF